MAHLTGDEKRKVYWKVFYILSILTIFEVGIGFAPLPHLLITLLIVTASLAKAAFVGWIYMHLNHETKGLKIILLFPLFVAFFYAVFLIFDARVSEHRHANPYIEQPKRFFGQRNLVERHVDDFGNTIVENKQVVTTKGSVQPNDGTAAEAQAEQDKIVPNNQDSISSAPAGTGAGASAAPSSEANEEVKQ